MAVTGRESIEAIYCTGSAREDEPQKGLGTSRRSCPPRCEPSLLLPERDESVQNRFADDRAAPPRQPQMRCGRVRRIVLIHGGFVVSFVSPQLRREK